MIFPHDMLCPFVWINYQLPSPVFLQLWKWIIWWSKLMICCKHRFAREKYDTEVYGWTVKEGEWISLKFLYVCCINFIYIHLRGIHSQEKGENLSRLINMYLFTTLVPLSGHISKRLVSEGFVEQEKLSSTFLSYSGDKILIFNS